MSLIYIKPYFDPLVNDSGESPLKYISACVCIECFESLEQHVTR